MIAGVEQRIFAPRDGERCAGGNGLGGFLGEMQGARGVGGGGIDKAQRLGARGWQRVAGIGHLFHDGIGQ